MRTIIFLLTLMLIQSCTTKVEDGVFCSFDINNLLPQQPCKQNVNFYLIKKKELLDFFVKGNHVRRDTIISFQDRTYVLDSRLLLKDYHNDFFNVFTVIDDSSSSFTFQKKGNYFYLVGLQKFNESFIRVYFAGRDKTAMKIDTFSVATLQQLRKLENFTDYFDNSGYLEYHYVEDRLLYHSYVEGVGYNIEDDTGSIRKYGIPYLDLSSLDSVFFGTYTVNMLYNFADTIQ